MNERYKVIKGSESAHCCFDATVVDTQTPHPIYHDKHDWVCECFDIESAQKIADALNATHYKQGGGSMIDYKLVPVEPTPDMLAAGHYAIEAGCHPSGIYADMLAAAPAAHGPQFLSDEKILEIASNPMVTPCSPWWLKNDVKAGDVQNSAIAFARAVLKAAAPGVQMEVVSWQFYEDGKWWNGDDRIKDHKRNTQEAGYRIRDVYAFSDGPTLVEECPLVKTLESIAEYWNQDGNEDAAMLNACEYTRSAALAALAAYRKQGGEV